MTLILLSVLNRNPFRRLPLDALAPLLECPALWSPAAAAAAAAAAVPANGNDPAGGGGAGGAPVLPRDVRDVIEGTIRDYLLVDASLDIADGTWWMQQRFQPPWWEHPPPVERVEAGTAAGPAAVPEAGGDGAGAGNGPVAVAEVAPPPGVGPSVPPPVDAMPPIPESVPSDELVDSAAPAAGSGDSLVQVSFSGLPGIDGGRFGFMADLARMDEGVVVLGTRLGEGGCAVVYRLVMRDAGHQRAVDEYTGDAGLVVKMVSQVRNV